MERFSSLRRAWEEKRAKMKKKRERRIRIAGILDRAIDNLEKETGDIVGENTYKAREKLLDIRTLQILGSKPKLSPNDMLCTYVHGEITTEGEDCSPQRVVRLLRIKLRK